MRFCGGKGKGMACTLASCGGKSAMSTRARGHPKIKYLQSQSRKFSSGLEKERKAITRALSKCSSDTAVAVCFGFSPSWRWAKNLVGPSSQSETYSLTRIFFRAAWRRRKALISDGLAPNLEIHFESLSYSPKSFNSFNRSFKNCLRVKSWTRSRVSGSIWSRNSLL